MTDSRHAPGLRVLDVALERDGFMRTLIRHLAGTLEEVVGLEHASGYVSLVGQRMAVEIGDSYKAALSVERLSRSQVRDVLVDLKRRIQGEFYVLEEHEDRIVFGNRRCPFGDRVLDRPSMCMMTSNVFGAITADNLGYARVELAETIARRSPECRIVVWLTPAEPGVAPDGNEYYGGDPGVGGV